MQTSKTVMVLSFSNLIIDRVPASPAKSQSSKSQSYTAQQWKARPDAWCIKRILYDCKQPIRVIQSHNDITVDLDFFIRITYRPVMQKVLPKDASQMQLIV